MTEETLRILMLADAGSVHSERFSSEMRRQGCDLLLASLESGTTTHTKINPRLRFGGLSYMTSTTNVRKLINKFQPHLINAHFAVGYGYIAARVLANSAVPLVLNLWGSDILRLPGQSLFHRWKACRALKAAAVVLADSAWLLEEANRLASVKHGQVVPWGIERSGLELKKTEFSLGRPLRIIVPRPHEPVYGNMFLLRSLSGLLNDGLIRISFPDWGSGSKRFSGECRKLGAEGVTLYSHLDRSAFLQFMAGHDLYLSNASSDSSPITLMEAMGLGLVVVAAEIPGINEWLTSESGFLFPRQDSLQLTECIMRIANSGDGFKEMRLGNMKLISEEGVFEDNVAKQLEIMRQLVKHAGKRP